MFKTQEHKRNVHVTSTCNWKWIKCSTLHWSFKNNHQDLCLLRNC